jgi:hypothetical protein
VTITIEENAKNGAFFDLQKIPFLTPPKSSQTCKMLTH